MNLIKGLFIDKKELKELDFGMLLSAVAILIFGVFNIYTATSSYYARLQLTWLVLSLGVVYVILLMDYRKVYKIVDVLYWIVVILLVVVLFTTKVKGAAGWFSIGTRGLQPAEFAKLTTMLMVGKQLQKVDGNLNNFRNFVQVTIYALIPVVLMLLQPEMGIPMITFFIVLGIYYVMGLSMKVILGGFGFIGLSILVVLKTNFLPSHWSDRLTSFLFNEGSELGINYQLSRSVISIGSGKISGKFDFGQFITDMSGQAQASTQFFNRVPENHTDFIFSVLAENFGLIGGVGIMPISGITLPLVSYGGSSVLTTFIAIGMVLNVGMKKKTTLFL